MTQGPAAARNAFVLTVNLHGSSVELLSTTEENLVGRYSYGGYLANGVDRLLDLFSQRGIKATFFVPGLEAERSKSLVREIHDEGHEVAANGYHYEDYSADDLDEHSLLAKTHDILGSVTGTAPLGWRAPKGTLKASTLAHLSKLGYLYDSSFQDDDFPYLLDADGGAGMIELPQHQMLIDQTLFIGKMADERVLKNWKEEYDGIRSIDGYACMTVHPRQDYGVGRAPRMVMLQRLLDHAAYVAEPPRFWTCGDLARRTKASD